MNSCIFSWELPLNLSSFRNAVQWLKKKTQEINIGIMLLGKAQMELEFEQFLD